MGKIYELKAAACLKSYPIHIPDHGGSLLINFRYEYDERRQQAFILNAFECMSGFRFGVKTLRAQRYGCWLDQLTDESFNL